MRWWLFTANGQNFGHFAANGYYHSIVVTTNIYTVNFFVTNGQSFGRFTANDQRHLDSLIVLLNEGTQLAWAVFSGTLKVFGAIHISNRWPRHFPSFISLESEIDMR